MVEFKLIKSLHKVLLYFQMMLTVITDYSLYDGTINCFSTLAQSSIASNETFNYKEVLIQSDKIKFVKVMVHEVNNHKKQNHWMLMKVMIFGWNQSWLSGVLSRSSTWIEF